MAKKNNIQLVLASTSKFRKQQLEQLKINFKVEASHVDESVLIGESPDEISQRLSVEKANSLRLKYPNALIVGSDQVISCEETVLGKPLNEDRALSTLHFINGKLLNIYSGICILNTQTGIEYKHVEKTEVKMRQLSLALIKKYLKKEPDALYCAGGVKSEGLGMVLIENMYAKDPNAVIGLPMYFLIDTLLKEGFDVI
ncbi:septum formation protein Maf [Neisseriaceae bacterium PsAf]|nr:septum formation protein Maf [Neisseriaceae bacterium PsAf]MCV2503061.1 Maf family nucleotide pyrophosphatase [Neisseriaceae bacterium]